MTAHPANPADCLRKARILILTLPHGAAHDRLAAALLRALGKLQPDVNAEVINALEHCAGWFRYYNNSYQLPLKYCPPLWGWIEGIQHTHSSTGPGWLYRRGAKPLFKFLQDCHPDLMIATEVGLCELAAMFKREAGRNFRLAAVPTGVDLDRAWAQPEVDLYAVDPHHAALELQAWGVPKKKILACGVPVDPAFESLPDRATARNLLDIPTGIPLVLILFGGTGVAARPRRLMAALRKVREPFHFVAMAGHNNRLRNRLDRCRKEQANLRVLGWVNNIHLWMAAADLLIGKPGGNTVFEAVNAGLPLLVQGPLPGSQRRTCAFIEEWKVGRWIKQPEDMPAAIQNLWRHPGQLAELRAGALAIRNPFAARQAVQGILGLLQA